MRETPENHILHKTLELQSKTGGRYDECLKTVMQNEKEATKKMLSEPVPPISRGGRRVSISNVATADRRILARERFHQAVHARMAERQEDYDKAYIACQKSHSEFFNEMSTQTPSRPEKAGILGLLVTSAEDEVDAAWKANDGAYPPNAVAIVDALTGFWQRKESLSAGEAKARALRHPTLHGKYNAATAAKS